MFSSEVVLGRRKIGTPRAGEVVFIQENVIPLMAAQP